MDESGVEFFLVSSLSFKSVYILVLLRAFAFSLFKKFYFTISKPTLSIIPYLTFQLLFYNIPNIPTFIFLYNTLK